MSMQTNFKAALKLCLCTWLILGGPRGANAADSTADALADFEALGTPVDGRAPLRVALLANAAVVTPGEQLSVGLWIHLDPGWHIYWQQPGAAGLSTQITWQVGHADMGQLLWPAPEVFRESDGVVTYGYPGETLLWAPAAVSDSVGQSLALEAHIDYLACNIICSPGQVTVRRTIPVDHASVPADASVQSLFTRYQKRVPMPPQQAGLQLDVAIEPNRVILGADFTVKASLRRLAQDGGETLRFRREPFIPDAAAGLRVHVVGARAASSAQDAALLTFRGRIDATDALQKTPAHDVLSGIIALEDAHGPLQPVILNVPLPPREALASAAGNLGYKAAAAPMPAVMPPILMPAAAPSDTSLAYVLLLALLGGLILNLMPCVLPVLALKVVGMLQIRQGPHGGRAILAHGFAYTAGVVASLGVLASVVCALRAAGQAVGWGFQFQEPWFVACVASILVLFALNCFGVFELYVGDAGFGKTVQQAQGLKRSAFDGVLAVILATPCSAPFLGTAIAFALQQRAWLIYLIFTTIGIGLSLPYVALTALPQGLKFVPKAGNWMLHLKVVLGFGLLITAVWIVWIMGRFVGVDGMARLLAILVITSLGAWIFGRISAAKPQRSLAFFAALLMLVAGLNIVGLRGVLGTDAGAPSAAGGLPRGWQVYSEAAVQEAMRRKQAVFVDFTADWCLTCKYNESHVLRDPAVRDGLAKKHVLMLRADWTRQDEAIRSTLARFGRAGVPMYLLYHPSSPDMPQLLPELLSISQLRDAIGNLP